MNFKSQIAPKGLEFKNDSFVISGKYATILTVVSYPRFIMPGYLANLTNISGIKLVIKHIPLPFSVLAKMLNKEIADLRGRYQQEKGLWRGTRHLSGRALPFSRHCPLRRLHRY